MSEDIPFADIVEAVSRGDPGAVEELERIYGRHLRRVARHMLRRFQLQNMAESLEICQSVWLDLLQNTRCAAFRTPEQVRAYLTAAVRNRVMALKRQQLAACRNRQRIEAVPVERHEIIDPTPGPLAQAMRQELLAEIQCRLGESMSQASEMHIAGLGWKQIAAALGYPVELLRKRYQRAISRLRRDPDIEAPTN
jgi:RNA polymerase sigma factor (sigma-70 family)